MEEIFNIEIISPEKIIFSGTAKMATIPSYEGDMSILKNHISIITFLRPGMIRLQTNENNIEEFFVEEGTIEYSKDKLIILSTSVINRKNLSKDFINNLNQEIENQLGKEDISDHERYVLNHKLSTIKELRV